MLMLAYAYVPYAYANAYACAYAYVGACAYVLCGRLFSMAESCPASRCGRVLLALARPGNDRVYQGSQQPWSLLRQGIMILLNMP